MNFYFFFFFLILCYGPWTTRGEVFLRPRENRAKEMQKKLNGDPRLSVINGLVQVATQAKTWAQWLRRLLKALRKWCNSHPSEVKLVKCFGSYFNIKIPKIPGLRRYEIIGRHYEESIYSKDTSKKLTRKAIADCARRSRLFQPTSLLINLFSLVQNFSREIKNRFKQYLDFISRNELVVCSWDYFWKKFWIWVDTATDHQT